MNTSNYHKLRNLGVTKCYRCKRDLEESDIIATSAGNKRYCYNCAAKINLVSGNLNKDLKLDLSLDETIYKIKEISKVIHLETSIELLAVQIIEESYRLSLIPSKNLDGLACAAIYLSTRIQRKDLLDKITTNLPVELRIIQKNFWTLRYLLINSKILEGFDGN